MLIYRMGAIASDAAGAFWLGKFTEAGADYGVAVDSEGNSYFCGVRNDSDNLFVFKINAKGALVWQKEYANSASGTELTGIAVDSSGNIAIAGTYQGAEWDRFVVAKLDSSGTLLWQKEIDVNNNAAARDVAIDSSGNIYAVGGSGNGALIVKYSTSGTLTWQRKLSSSSFEAVKIFPSGNIAVVGTQETISGAGILDRALFVIYSSTGTVLDQRTLNTSFNVYGSGIAIFNDNNAYMLAYRRGFETTNVYIVKYEITSNSASIKWQKSFSSSSNTVLKALGVATDSLGNVYVSGKTSQATTPYPTFIFKFDSAGTVLWKRTVTNPTSTQNRMVQSGRAIYIAGSVNLALPIDGSGLGTYTLNGDSYVYAASTLALETPNYGNNAASLTTTTPTYSAINSSYTASTSSYTWNVVTF